MKALSFLLLILFSSAFNYESLESCSIILTDEQDSSSSVTIYSYMLGHYARADSFVMPGSAFFRLSDDNHIEMRFSVTYPNPETRLTTELYGIANNKFEIIDTLGHFGSFIVMPRTEAWSSDNNYVALSNAFDNSNDRLFVYDILDHKYVQPVDLEHVYEVHWSPSGHRLALVAFDEGSDDVSSQISRINFGIYIADFSPFLLLRIPLETQNISRLQWLADNLLGITVCQDIICTLYIYHMDTGELSHIIIGDYLVESYISSIDKYLLSDRGTRNLYAFDSVTGATTAVTTFEEVFSSPIISLDERFFALLASDANGLILYIYDIIDMSPVLTVPMTSDRPELNYDNTGGIIDYSDRPYFPFGVWHPREPLLLYADNNSIYVLDADAGTMRLIINDSSFGDYPTIGWNCAQ